MTSLSISVSGTAYLQKCIAAGKMPGQIPYDGGRSAQKVDAATGKPSGADALGRASDATRDAVEHAIKLYSPTGSTKGYRDGNMFADLFGNSIDIIA